MVGKDGVEPSYVAYQATVLPLNYIPIKYTVRDSNPQHSACKADTLTVELTVHQCIVMAGGAMRRANCLSTPWGRCVSLVHSVIRLTIKSPRQDLNLQSLAPKASAMPLRYSMQNEKYVMAVCPLPFNMFSETYCCVCGSQQVALTHDSHTTPPHGGTNSVSR